ncbi:hypothetical protein Tco_1077515 [Tanacetum coccineum]
MLVSISSPVYHVPNTKDSVMVVVDSPNLPGNVSTSCNVADLQPYFDPEEPLPSLRTNPSDEGEDDRQAPEYPISALDLNPPEPSSDISPVDSGQNLQKWVSLVQSDSLKT